jgi:hypothetical protein
MGTPFKNLEAMITECEILHKPATAYLLNRATDENYIPVPDRD